jgi:DHA1 family tetracycline resistance protein-like MFS transporter
MAEAVLGQRQKRRSVLAVTTVVFVDALGFALVLPILPLVANELFGAGKLMTGLLVATFPFFQLIAAPYLGRFSDVHGRRPVLVFTMMGAAVGFAVMAFAEWTTLTLQAQGVAWATTAGLLLLFLSRTINGLTGGNLPVAQAYLADVTTPEERAEAMGGITVAFALAYGIGPAVAGHLAGDGSLYQPALLGCGIALLGTLLVYFMLPESRRKVSFADRPVPMLPGEREASFEDDVFGEKPHWNRREITDALREKATGPLLWQWCLFILCFSLFAPMFALIASDSYGLRTREIGLLLSFFAVLAIIWQLFFLKPAARRLGDHRLALLGLAAFLSCFALLALVPTGTGGGGLMLLTLMMMLFGLGFAATRPALTSAISRAVPEHQVGSIMGVSQSLDSASTVIGPLMAGVILEFFNVHWLGVIAVIFAGAALAVNWRDGWR